MISEYKLKSFISIFSLLSIPAWFAAHFPFLLLFDSLTFWLAVNELQLKYYNPQSDIKCDPGRFTRKGPALKGLWLCPCLLLHPISCLGIIWTGQRRNSPVPGKRDICVEGEWLFVHCDPEPGARAVCYNSLVITHCTLWAVAFPVNIDVHEVALEKECLTHLFRGI